MQARQCAEGGCGQNHFFFEYSIMPIVREEISGSEFSMEGLINYAPSEMAWVRFEPFVRELIERCGSQRVLDIGGGANPVLDSSYLAEHGIDYVVLDCSEAELQKMPSGYGRYYGDISDPALQIKEGFDLVFSRMVAEHVKDAEAMHRNIYRILKPGGMAFHFFPTLYALPFVANLVVPESLASQLLWFLAPGRSRYRQAKFPAYYSWCRGPTKSQLRRFRSMGYEIVEYAGYFGHSAYYRRVPLLSAVHCALAGWLCRHPMPLLTSFAQVLLRRPVNQRIV